MGSEAALYPETVPDCRRVALIQDVFAVLTEPALARKDAAEPQEVYATTQPVADEAVGSGWIATPLMPPCGPLATHRASRT